jgi:hypothetical protein
MSQVVRVPFEKMPKASSSMSLNDAINPEPGSAHEFTKIWMDKVGPDQYFKQMMQYQSTVGFK